MALAFTIPMVILVLVYNISNNAVYSDVSTNVLTLTSPSTFNGYRYR
jgi:hypothetical protein